MKVIDILSLKLKQRVKSLLCETVLQIEPTRRCNFSCLHCNHRNDGGFLDIEVYKAILANHPKIGMVKLQGLGEPLLHPQIQELINLAKVAGHKVMIITNGSFKYVNNVDEYVFSLETLDFTKFESIGKRNLSNVIKNIRYAASKQRVLINCVQCSQTTPQDVLDVQSFAREIGAKIKITPQEVWVEPSHPEYPQQLGDAKQAWQIHGVKVDYKKYVVCSWGISEFFYDYTGTPHPCCIRMTDEYRNLKPSSEICKNCPL